MIIVGIGEYVITNNIDESVVTYALGSCVALIIHSPKSRYTAMAHIVLPRSGHPDIALKKEMRPAYFAEHIIPGLMRFFLREMKEKPTELQVTLVGGADSRKPGDVFQVGRRNVDYIRKKLDEYGIRPQKEQVGNHMSRTVSIEVESGQVAIKQQKMLI